MQNQPTEPQNEPQNDFWDLGDDDLDPDEAKESSQPKQQPTDSASAQDTPAAPLEEILSDLDDDPLPPALPPQETEPAVPPETTPTPRRYRAKETGREATPTTEIEKIFIGSLLAVLVGLTVWGGYTYVGAAPNGNLAEYKEDFPIHGESVTIESVETWWREPVRSGGDPDVGVVVEARLIPCASIKISEGGSSTLQVSFRDGEDQLIGDILNLSVSNGKFENGSNEALVYGTDGFTNPTTINPYVNQDIAPWTLAIVESADGAEPIVKTRIEANRKEK
ncbi:hypothetical protein N9A95_03355 [Akkermansiaceae bacterium]|nr:hypothetical protein [Akkermansiaceae bacterium]MDA7872783.1 hypothetical protein [Akkermansiaceae bacterium]